MDIALLNIMPDPALKATDRQLRNLLANQNGVHLHPFTFPEVPRGEKAAAYIKENYQSQSQVLALDPDAIFITGTNVIDPRLETQCFWDPLIKLMDWSQKNTRSTLCSCLALC